jgi:hypothetical protein
VSIETSTLRGLLDGRMHLPGDPGYDAARTPWNVAVDQRPAAVAVPRTADEVVEVVRAATAAGLRVAPQSTGHGAGPLGFLDLSDVLLLRLHELTGVSIDADARTARITGGTLWRDVLAAAAPYGLTAMHGSAPDVAAVGYLLGGGLSFYGRAHGVAANSVRALEVVTADGALVRASVDEHADLFWALRGGGGSFGVVVAIEIELLPYADVYAGMLLWDRERSPEVLRAWTAWTREVPESVTTSLRVMSFPPLPDLPPFLSGRQLVVIDGAILEDDERAAELLAPLRALAPEMDTFGRIPSADLVDVHMDPPEPAPSVGDHAVIADLPEEAVAALLAEIGPGSTSSLLFGELRHLGGALGRPAAGGGVTSHLEGAYVLFAVAITPFPEAVVQGRADALALCAAMAPWCTDTQVLNFSESASAVVASAYGDRWERLLAVRTTVDPTGVFVANHPVQ